MSAQKNIPLILIPFFALLAPFFGALSLLQISLLHPEVAALATALFLVCLSFAGLLIVTGPKLRTLLLAMLTFFVLDISAKGWTRLSFVVELVERGVGQKIVRVLAILVVLALLYALLWKLRRHAPQILATAFGVMFFSTLLIAPPPLKTEASFVSASEPKSQKDLPLWIHLFFDEMMAPEAINRALPLGGRLYKTTRKFFDKHGFRLYGQAFSRFYWTDDSASALFNFDAQTRYPLAEYTDKGSRPSTLRANAYFREAAEYGYNIHVYQTRHLNLCDPRYVSRCETLNSFNRFSSFVASAESSFSDRTIDLATNLVTAYKDSNTSAILESALSKLGRWAAWYDAEAFPAWFKHFTEQLVQAPRGTLVFAHMLVPHTPFVWNEDCEFQSRVPPHYFTAKNPRPMHMWQEFERRHQELYYAQALCTHRHLEALFEALEAFGRLDDAIVIVHGDHGARISRSQYIEHMSAQDLIANHAALF
ncbi:MAG: sulfatase-like hydrolase/transferase, partial [Burkholderiales bacterium]